MAGTRRDTLRFLTAAVGAAGLALHDGGEAESRQKRQKRRRIARNRRRKRRRSQTPRAWQLSFSDEFDQGSLDRSKWTLGTPWFPEPFDQGELQRYDDDAVRVASGELQIEAVPESGENSFYRSGMISTYASFAQRFGRFEIRCKLPAGQGLWPAFWLLPASAFGPPEIDILEALGHEKNSVYMNAHWRFKGKHRQAIGKFVGPDFTDDFHTFAVEWDAHKLVFFVDGVQRHRIVDHTPKRPMYLLANLAVGGNWPGNPDESTPFPATFVVDYIRVYQSVSATGVRADARPRKRPSRSRVPGRARRRGSIHRGIDIRSASRDRRSKRSRKEASFANG
jgi:beta-glucanase (GH16 family)